MPSCQAAAAAVVGGGEGGGGGGVGCNLWAAGVEGLDLEVADDALPVMSG